MPIYYIRICSAFTKAVAAGLSAATAFHYCVHLTGYSATHFGLDSAEEWTEEAQEDGKKP